MPPSVSVPLPVVTLFVEVAVDPVPPNVSVPMLWLKPLRSSNEVAPPVVERMVTFVLVPVPKASLAPSRTVPVAITRASFAVAQLAAALPRVSVPRPDFVRVRATPPSVRAPRTRLEFAPTVKPALPVRVVAPKVVVAVPETLPPALAVRVKVPIESVPSELLTLLPSVRRSDWIVLEAATVVLRPKARPVSSAIWRVPALRESAPAPRAEAEVVARSVPALTVVVPV